MNIGMLNNNLNFGRVLVSTDGMGKMASALANKLEQEINYSDSIRDLDNMGVDVVIISDPESREDRAKILFATKDDHLYKIDGKDYMRTGKTFDIGRKRTDYSTNSEKVLDVAQKIVDGEIASKTIGTTKSVKEMLSQFWIR